jgi:hypothetical protein
VVVCGACGDWRVCTFPTEVLGGKDGLISIHKSICFAAGDFVVEIVPEGLVAVTVDF